MQKPRGEQAKEPLPRHPRVKAHRASRRGGGSPFRARQEREVHAASPPGPGWTDAPPEPRAFRFSEPVSPPRAVAPGWGTPGPRGASTCSADARHPACSRAPGRRSSRAGVSPGGARGAGWAEPGAGREGPGAGGSGTCRRRAAAAGAPGKGSAHPAQEPPGPGWAAPERPCLPRKGKLRPSEGTQLAQDHAAG